MKSSKWLAVLALALSGAAYAQITTQVRAVEASTSVINFPTAPNGNLSFKPCAERCDQDYINVRLAESTQYVSQGRTVTFDEFRNAFLARRGRASGYALITFRTEHNIATRVEVAF
jgi:hypothetical protein